MASSRERATFVYHSCLRILHLLFAVHVRERAGPANVLTEITGELALL